MVKANSSETLILTYQNTGRNIPDSRIQNLTYGVQIFHETIV